MLLFKNKNAVEIKVTPFGLNVSMDDLYVVTSISRKIIEEGLDLAKVWTDYAINDVISDEFHDYKKDHSVAPETHVEVYMDGAEFIIINEEGGNFVPLFLCSVNSVKFVLNDGSSFEET